MTTLLYLFFNAIIIEHNIKKSHVLILILVTLFAHTSCTSTITNDNHIDYSDSTIRNSEIISVSINLVQRRTNHRVASLNDLIGKSVFVEKNTLLHHHLEKLNDEIGGGIRICAIKNNSNYIDLIQLVSNGSIDFAVAETDIADAYRIVYPHLDVALRLSLPYKKNKSNINISDTTTYLSNEPISNYDAIFKKHSTIIGWDWRMLAAMAWNESRFNPNAESHVGAKGLMQMMPNTARKFGIENVDSITPEESIIAAVAYLKYIDKMFKDVVDGEERLKFIFASYNAGPGHVRDAMRLADKYGYNKYLWEDNVEKFLLLKNQKKYYTDSVCYAGYFRAKHTTRYIDDIYSKYSEYVEY